MAHSIKLKDIYTYIFISLCVILQLNCILCVKLCSGVNNVCIASWNAYSLKEQSSKQKLNLESYKNIKNVHY